MSAGRHSSGQSKTPWGLVAGVIMVPAGVVCGIAAVAEGSGYSAANPGASGAAAAFGVLAVILIGVPFLAMAVSGIVRYSAWKRTLTPGQRLALSVAELAALEGAHLAIRDHNRDESARLSESAMGAPRGGE